MKAGKFRIPGKKALLKDSDYPEVVVMDVRGCFKSMGCCKKAHKA
jgi:hypothetical protein